ncbi:fasciclin domain-containing protein [Actinomadura roseirufa]|uniref:fasciclin domain-containing protein n=1 Tax=Actinomadura roseirufa TaxID=2094049 RepID=UPI00104166BB|nr:fasciclin domain-containing protein [Actinomadura roseirufa]
MTSTRVLLSALAGAALVLGAAACSGGGEDGDAAGATGTPANGTPAGGGAAAAPAAGTPFGGACSAVPASGKGSFTGMAADPVATAASNNPVLSTLVTAVKKAGLVDTLNSAKDITVFAPTNDAFKKIPKDTLDKVLADKKALTGILTYHVVGRRIAPGGLAYGDFTTLQGSMLKTSGSGESFKVGDGAGVVCGNVRTANATVYIIDGVLMPPK